MKNIVKATKLDFALMKGYILPLCIGIALPILFALEGSTLITCISLAMGVTAMGLHYTFTVAEKKDMSRMYGVIPITKRDLVLGKYLYVLIVGIIVLVISLIAQPIAFSLVGNIIKANDIFIAAFSGITIYSILVSVQLPGFYKLGSINGKMFTILPFAVVIIGNGIIKRSGFDFNTVLQFINANQLLTAIMAIVFVVLLLTVSIIISIQILKRKEL